ncbi:phosphoribosyltransferase [Derxia gummosa]|uniref:Phosphoribosyltransferase n=1 Tax=Derxia gummosa DSM 723 TaxID=1121388 RepID=A0A8B6X6S5_9BURK|nr:phosphoribosyltransferase family protein [Derxia gummosa]
MNDLFVTWEEYHDLVEDLAVLVHESGWEYDQILCLARGGTRIGDVFSRIFEKPYAILTTSSYREDSGTKQSTLLIADHFTSTTKELGRRVLLVDDLADSGKTIVQVIDHLRAKYPQIEEVRTAVLWHKAHSVYKPDYAVRFLTTNPWIHQPFELYDHMRIDTLLRRAAQRRSDAASQD